MKIIENLVLFICLSLLLNISIFAQSGIFVGGPSYYNPDFAIDELKNSGFTTVIVWTIHINDAGELNFNGEFLVCKDGEYIGNQKYPNFPKDMALLKTAPTSINRLEIGLSAWGSSTFGNIKNLVESEGTSENSILYKNFKALKENIPAFDAVNFDDESTYDEPSSTQFAIMLADLGFKVTLAPYTASDYWMNLAKNTNAQRPGTVDLVYLQCYAGGSGNSPCDWNGYFDGIPVYPGLWGSQTGAATVQSSMEGYNNNCGSEGGFIWIYDEVKNSVKVEELAEAINNSFSITYNLDATISSPSPFPNAIEVDLNKAISWTASESAVSHDVYFGTSVNPELQGNQSATVFTPNNVEQNTRYFWRIDEITTTDTIKGNVYTFHTVYPLPTIVVNPKPENEVQDVPVTQSLSWSSVHYATNYKLYLGQNNVLSEGDLISEQTKTVYVPSEALAPNTIYYWRVDSENLTGTTEGITWSFTTKDSVTELSGYALSFDGSKTKVTIENSSSLSISGRGITIEAWINPEIFKGETWQGSILLKDYTGGAGQDYGYGVRCGGQGEFDVVLGGGNWQELKSPTNSISLNIWTHIAATYDGTNIKLYVNGEEVADKRVSFNILSNANNVMIGESPGFPGRVFNGKIDEVRIWNVARNAYEIKRYMNANLGSATLNSEASGLVGYWDFNEGTEQQAKDKSYFGNHGVLGTSTSEQDSDPQWINSEVIVGISDDNNIAVLPSEYRLEQNYPNPFNPTTKITFSVPEDTRVKLEVYDVRGRLVDVIENDNFKKGIYSKTWEAKNLSSGMYFIKLNADSFSKTIKTILLK